MFTTSQLGDDQRSQVSVVAQAPPAQRLARLLAPQHHLTSGHVSGPRDLCQREFGRRDLQGVRQRDDGGPAVQRPFPVPDHRQVRRRHAGQPGQCRERHPAPAPQVPQSRADVAWPRVGLAGPVIGT
jgi:hypothetical protein